MEMKGGGGEVRRLNIIYFLSRTGRVEHPHLIRVHHPAPNGVYLRDVKRWLSELRGNDLAESFAWSYKRRYKAGYLWQDLLDDDLITPISDCEFILKGSEIPSSADGDKKQHQASGWEEHGQPCCPHKSHDPSLSKTSTHPPEIIEESIQFGSDSSASMEYSVKQGDKSGHLGEKEDSCHSSLLNKPRTKKTGTSLLTVPRYKPALSQQAVHGSGRSKSQSTASSILRNLTTCCTVGTTDSVSVPRPYHIKKSSPADPGPEICNREKLGHSARMSEALWNRHQDQNSSTFDWRTSYRHSFDGVRDSRKKTDSSQFYNLKPVPATYRPVSCPSCSQCGKPFKPEKLHSHMKSCRGMKMLARNSASGSGTRDKAAASQTPGIYWDKEAEHNSFMCH